MKKYKHITLFVIILFLVSINKVDVFAQKNSIVNKILGWEEHYDQPPNIQVCYEGKLKDNEKIEVLNYVNFIRSIHGLKPVQYDLGGDIYAQKSSLIMAANAQLSHQPPSSWSCYTNEGYYGAENSNLHINYSTSNNLNPRSIESIIGWMIDDKSGNAPDRCGHRRAIINPFLTSIAFGRVDGKSNVGNYYCSAMSLLYLDRVNGAIQDRPVEFVAYPYQNYPIELVNKSWYLSFTPYYDMNSWSRNTNVDYSNAKITVTTDDGTPLQVHSIVYDFEGWGAVHNNIRWMVNGLQNEVRYNVNITGIVVNGKPKDYSYWFKLTNNVMGLKPNTPVLSYPQDGATNMPFSLSFSWSISEFTYQYRFQLSKNPDMSKPVRDEAVIANGIVVTGLEQLTTYYWRVKAINDIGESDWTPIRSFTTAAPKPDKPELVSPPNEATNLSITPTLVWRLIPGAEEYQVQVSTKSDFSGFSVAVDSYTSDTSFTVPFDKLMPKITYYWRVRSRAAGQNSTWSSVWKFQTKEADPIPEATTPQEPKMNEENVKLNARFKWAKVDFAKYYRLQIAKSNSFAQTEMVFNKNIDTNEYQLMGNEMLQPNTKYYWRVQAVGESGFSNWSTTYVFTTEKGTKVEENIFEKYVEIFPNPSLDFINIMVSNKLIIEKIEIFDLLGNSLLVSDKFTEATTQINISTLDNGVYIIKLTTHNGVVSKKFIKNKV